MVGLPFDGLTIYKFISKVLKSRWIEVARKIVCRGIIWPLSSSGLLCYDDYNG